MAELTVRFSRSEIAPDLQSYDLRVEITSATDMPTEVFVLHRQVAPPQSIGAEPTDVFQCVADPVDLEEFPPGSPSVAEDEMPYYRVNDITLRFRSVSELEDVRRGIDEDLKGLVRALNFAETLPIQEEITHD